MHCDDDKKHVCATVLVHHVGIPFTWKGETWFFPLLCTRHVEEKHNEKEERGGEERRRGLTQNTSRTRVSATRIQSPFIRISACVPICDIRNHPSASTMQPIYTTHEPPTRILLAQKFKLVYRANAVTPQAEGGASWCRIQFQTLAPKS